MMFRIFLCIGLVGLLSACRPSKPSGVLSESKLIPILVDYHLAQGMAETTDDEVANRYLNVQAVFRKHRISEAQFDTTMVYYCEHAEDLSRIYIEVNRRIEAAAAVMGMDTQTQLKYHEMSSEGDTANIWSRRHTALIRPNTFENIYSFVLDADSSIYPGDRFMWTFESQYVLQGGSRDAYVQLIVCYENDSVASTTQMISGNQEIKVKVSPSRRQDTLRVKSIQGHVYMPLPNSKDKNFKILLLKDIALIRYHMPGEKPRAKVVPAQPHTAVADTVPSEQHAETSRQRLSPAQLREAQPRDQRIHVVKEKPVNPRLRPARAINQPLRRTTPSNR